MEKYRSGVHKAAYPSNLTLNDIVRGNDGKNIG